MVAPGKKAAWIRPTLILLVVILLVVAFITIRARFLKQPQVEVRPLPKPQVETASKSPEISATPLTSHCMKRPQTVIDRAIFTGLIYKIDREQLSVSVGRTWSELPLDEKTELDLAIHCAIAGESRVTGIKYLDYRSGKTIATSDDKLHME
jgi:hypothetical protein